MTNENETNKLERKPLIIFLIIAFLPAWLLFVFPIFFESAEMGLSRIVGLASWSLAMWMPGLGALIATIFGEQKQLRELRLGKLGNKKIYLWAWLVPIILTVGAALVTWLFGWGRVYIQGELFSGELIETQDIPFITSPLMLIGAIASTMTLAPLFNTLFTLGEELGWRGYLLPKLLPLGQIPAILLSGLIWGIWHAPVILMGHNYPGYPVLGVGMMMVFTILMGVFLSWLYLKTKSPWAPALSHATLNAVASLPLIVLFDFNPVLGGAITSLSGWIVLALLTLILVGIGEIPVNE